MGRVPPTRMSCAVRGCRRRAVALLEDSRGQEGYACDPCASDIREGPLTLDAGRVDGQVATMLAAYQVEQARGAGYREYMRRLHGPRGDHTEEEGR